MRAAPPPVLVVQQKHVPHIKGVHTKQEHQGLVHAPYVVACGQAHKSEVMKFVVSDEAVTQNAA